MQGQHLQENKEDYIPSKSNRNLKKIFKCPFDREHRSRGPRNYFDDDDEGTFLNLALKKPGRDQIVIEIH